MDLHTKETNQRKYMQLLFLVAAGIVPFLSVLMDTVLPGVGYFLAEKWMAVPCLLFFGSALTQRLSVSGKRSLLLAGMAVLWFAAAQMQHHLNHMGTRNFGIFAVVYLLAFPFAPVTEDGRENVGLKWIGRIYVAFSLLMVSLAMLLQLDAVPELFQSRIIWDGIRLQLFWHPNGSAFVLLLGIGFSLYFLTQADQKWKKIVLVILVAMQFCTQILTNSRTTIFLSCALIAGTVFFAMWKGSWKQFLAGAAAAVAVFVALLLTYSLLFDLHTQEQVNKLLEQTAQSAQTAVSETQAPGMAKETEATVSAEESTEKKKNNNTQNLHVNNQTGEVTIAGSTYSGQGELSSDIKTFNGRTSIWKAALTSLRDNPSTLLWGTEYVSEEISFRMSYKVINAHNSWLQMWMLLGTPGFLMTVIFTVIAVWNLWILMWRRDEDLGRKVVAMVVLCLLLGSILEVYLFTGEDASNCENFAFFLCTGYLVQWNRLSAGKE